MKKLTLCIAATMALTACAGTDPAQNNGMDDNNGSMTNNNVIANNTNPNNTTGNNTNPNNTNPNNTNPNNTTGNNTNNTTGNNTNNTGNNVNNTNNGEPVWRALVANGDFTADVSTWSILVFDGTTASTTVAQEFGSGQLAVAASGNRGYVVDLTGGMLLVLDATTGTEITTVDLQVGEIDTAASANGMLTAAGGDMGRIAQYSDAAGGLGQAIPIAGLSTGDPLYIRSMSMDGNMVAGTSFVSAMFPTTPKAFVADTSTATLLGDVEVTGLTDIDSRGDGTFALGTEFNGIKVLREDGGEWNADTTLVEDTVFSNAEVEGVVMADANVGVALTYDVGPGFQAYTFDASTGTSTPISGLALPTGLIGGDASSDGEYFFIGDYGIRNPDPQPWGVAVIDREGGVLQHVMTDDNQPPMDIAALD